MHSLVNSQVLYFFDFTVNQYFFTGIMSSSCELEYLLCKFNFNLTSLLINNRYVIVKVEKIYIAPLNVLILN